MPTDRSPHDRLAGLASAPAPAVDVRPQDQDEGADAARGVDDAAAVRARALASATSVYAATYGHPLEHPTTSGHVRWGTSARTALVVVAALALTAAAVVIHVLAGAPSSVVVAEEVVPEAPVAVTSEPTPVQHQDGTEEPAPALLLVHVVGSVQAPGVVELPPGSRVVDAVAAAGGATAEADLSALNLARPVVDGEQVLVPRPGQEVPSASVGATGPGAPGAGGAAADPGLVDVNRATATELETLTGIGPVLAARIVEHREEHGPFFSVDDLQAVRGIGPSLLADLRDQVTT